MTFSDAPQEVERLFDSLKKTHIICKNLDLSVGRTEPPKEWTADHRDAISKILKPERTNMQSLKTSIYKAFISYAFFWEGPTYVSICFVF